jgi:hypothetical protein
MNLYKITKKATWLKHGVPTHYIKYMKCKTKKEVLEYHGEENILKIEKL